MAKKRMRAPMVLAVAAFAGLALAAVAASAQPATPVAAHAAPAAAPTAYGITFDGLITDHVALQSYAGNVILVVNTASRCGFTPQYAGLQALYSEFSPRGLVIVGVPSGDFREQELGTAKEIAEFCRLNYGVTFPMAAKYHVIGAGAHPFYRWAQASRGDSAAPRWNFHKILIGRDGHALAAFPSATKPDDPAFRAAVLAALAARG